MAKILTFNDIGNNYLGLIDVPEREKSAPNRPFFGVDAISIDSLKLRIPEKRVTIIDDELKGTWRTFNDATGNEDSRLAKHNRKYIETHDGVKINFQVEKITLSRNPESFLTLELPSKLLTDRYFEGIQNTTVETVYRRLMSFNIVRFSFNDFVASDCTDIDFKRDLVVNQDFDVKTAIQQIYSQSNKPEGSRIYTRQGNMGVQWSDRHKPNAITTPFLKIYSKGLELQTKQRNFYSAHLSQFDVSGIIRLEATLKNRKHYRHIYGDSYSGMRLGSLLDMSQADKRKLFDYAASKYKLMAIPATSNQSELKGSNLVKLSLLRELRRLGHTREMAKKIYLSEFEGVPNKCRYEREFEEIWNILEVSKGTDSIYTYDFFWKN